MRFAFRSLRTHNYRLYFGGQAVSLVGTWMQIIAQGWLVAVKLKGGGVGLGVVTALQFGPTLVAGMWGGLIADRFPKRRILLVTQSLFVVQGLALAVLVQTGAVRLWMVYVLAFLYGCVQVPDMPTRQAFVPEMVRGPDVMNAVSLNAGLFNAARMVGAAAAGVLIAKVGMALCFYVNAVSFFALIVALLFMREHELAGFTPRTEGRGQIRAGLAYVRSQPDLLLPLLLMAVVSTFGLNFQVVLPLIAKYTYRGDAQTFGLLSTVVAVGSVAGAMFAATRQRPTRRMLAAAAVGFGMAELAAAFAPSLHVAFVLFPLVGCAMFVFITTSNSTLQLAASPEMRGRVLSLFSLVFLGSTPIGGPIIGWISERWSPRAGLGVGGLTSLLAGVAIGSMLLAQGRSRRTETLELRGDDDVLAEPVAVAGADSP